jgi:phosphate-selective porin OprO/OprP
MKPFLSFSPILVLCVVVSEARAQDATPRPGAAPAADQQPMPAAAAPQGVVPAPAPETLPPAPPAPTVPAASPPAVIVSPGPSDQAHPSHATPSTTGGPGDPASAAAGPGGFSLTTLDGKWELRLRALVQTDGRFWIDDAQRPQTDTFLIRRAQPILDGRLPHGISFAIIPDFGRGTLTLLDAYFGLDVNEGLRFRFGKFFPRFGLERLKPLSNLTFVELGLPSLLTPSGDVGAMVHGDLFGRFFGYAAGVFNGVPDNGSGDLDSDNEKEFAGRVYLRPFAPLPTKALGRLFIGVATTFGWKFGTPANPNFASPTSTPVYKTPGQVTDFSYIAAAPGVAPDSANTVVANGRHNRYGAYLFEALGPFSLMGEYYLSDQIVARAGAGNAWIHNKAFGAQATFFLFGANASYDFVHVETPLDPARGHFGALEVAGRVGHLDIDTAAFPNFASPGGSVRGATEIAAGLNWYVSDNGKFVVNWDNTQFQGGAKTPTELAAGHREAENVLFLRAQVVY